MKFEGKWAYQQKPVDFLLANPNAALFAEQGVGKTFITLGVLDELAESFCIEALIVVPLSNIKTTWEKALELIDVEVFRTWEDFKAANCRKILLIHYQAMTKYEKKITRHEWDFVVFDESQKIKARGSKQSRIAGRIKKAHRRLILTGTPFDDLMENPQELWAQFRFVHPTLFGTRWKSFDERYLMKTGWMGKQRKFRRGMYDRVMKMVEPFCYRMELLDHVNLEEPEYINHPALMLGKQRRLYETMERDMVTTINGEEVSADLAITLLVKLQQIASGFVKDDEGEIHRVGRAKMRQLKRVLKTTDLPVVIFCKYLEEIDQIVEEIEPDFERVSTIVGSTRRTRDATIEAFQQGQIDVLVAQIKTGGVGIDLWRSHEAIFYSSTFSFIDFEQAISRLQRAGQTHRVKIHLLYAQKTIDKLIFEALLLKRSASEMILRKFKRPQQGDPIMARKNTKAEKTEKKTEKKTKDPAPKYGIADLADALAISPASARVKLRRAKVKKNGGRYGWDTKAELNEVVAELKAQPEKKSKKED